MEDQDNRSSRGATRGVRIGGHEAVFFLCLFGQASLFGDTGAANPLAVEAGFAGDLSYRLVGGECREDFGGECLSGFLLGLHGCPVRAPEAAQSSPALIVHAHMVPQGMRHYLLAYVHGEQYDTT